MQKKILAAVVASMMAGQAMAITVVDDGTNKASIGGHAGMRYIDQDKGESAGDSSRINFAFEHMMTQDTTAFSKVEWGFDVTNTDRSKSFFKNRLGYVGLKNEQLGSLTFGKQWSTYFMISEYTDQFAVVGGDATGTYGAYGESLGTSRADDAIQYNFSSMGLNISAQAQLGKRELMANAQTVVKRDNSYAIAASYDLPMGLSFGAAYNQAKVKGTDKVAGTSSSVNHKSAVFGAKFEADAIYGAVTYTKLKNTEPHDYLKAIEKADGIEVYASYKLNDMIKFETGYNQLKDKSDAKGKGELKYFPIAAVYTQGPVQLSGTYQFDKSKKSDGSDVKDKVVVQARYYF